jgi:hypothetical protein
MPYRAKGVPTRFVSVGPATAAKASSEGWRLCLRPNTDLRIFVCSIKWSESVHRPSLTFLHSLGLERLHPLHEGLLPTLHWASVSVLIHRYRFIREMGASYWFQLSVLV